MPRSAPGVGYDTRMTYQVLARKWRPQSFADLLGQEGVVQTLTNALRSGTVGHAYLFSGLRGVGKTTVARLLAKAVNCVEGPTAEPCGSCDSCREVADGSSIDVVEVDGASNRKIEDVRELRELLLFHPTRDRYRVIIIDEVHMLTREAFNALLKSLEEPPPYILWIFATTERVKVPDTILSRCQQLEFRPVGTDLIRERLTAIAGEDGFELAPSAAAAIAAAAEGSVRDALSLLDQLRAFAADVVDDDAVAAVIGVPPVEVTVGVLRAVTEGRVGDGLARLREQLAAGRDPHVLYRECGRALRSALHLAIDPALEPGLAENHRGLLQPLADEIGSDGLGRMLGLWLEHGRMLDDSANRELALEVAMLRMARWPAVRAVESWLSGTGGSQPLAGPQGDPSPPPARSQGGPGAASDAKAAARETAEQLLSGAAGKPALEVPPEGASLDDERERERRLKALAEEARSDPAVSLATRVLGGEVIAVRPDHDAP